MMLQIHCCTRFTKILRTAALFLVVSSVTSFVLVPSRGFSSSIRGCQESVLTAKKKNDWGDAKALQEFCAEQEAKATAATESWVVDATGFLEPEQSSALLEKLGDRADVNCLSVGSYRGDSNSRRVRCVYCNPDLGYDQSTADSDYVCYLRIDNVGLSECDPWPNILVKIGLSLDAVGDVFVVENESTVYLAVTPESEKTCARLLPKELPGTGVTVSTLSKQDMDDEMAAISDTDGQIVDEMEVQRLDKRKQ